MKRTLILAAVLAVAGTSAFGQAPPPPPPPRPGTTIDTTTPTFRAKQVLGDLGVPGLVKAETVNGLSFEWDVKVLDKVQS